MKRAEVSAPKEYPVVKEYANIPKSPPHGVLVKTSFCGVCHSDLRNWKNLTLERKFPAIFGHEISGVIHSFGDKAERRGLEVGDNIVVYPWVGCGTCAICQTDNPNYCNDRTRTIGCATDGGFSNFVLVRETKFVMKVPDAIPMDVACMLPCSGLTAYSALLRAKPQVPESNGHVMVIGAGGLGLWCLKWIRLCLPKGTKSVCVDVNDEKLDIARQNGADDVILFNVKKNGDTAVTEKLISEVKNDKSEGGFDAVLDFVNSSDTAKLGFAALRKNGIHIAVGLWGGKVTLDLIELVYQVKKVSGSYTGGIHELRDLLEIVATSGVQPPPIEYCKLEDIGDVWKDMELGKLKGRTLIKHD